MRYAALNTVMTLIVTLTAISAPHVALAQQTRTPGMEVVSFPSTGAGGTTLTAYLKRPEGIAKPPVVVGLHGCGGLLTRSGALQKREIDWIDRLVGWGYAVLYVDSFTPRSFREVCTLAEKDRPIRPIDRAQDVAAAVTWIATQPTLDASRMALIGWSHGGSSTLWSVDRRLKLQPADFRTAIAFYPGCRPFAGNAKWQPRVPLSILIGSDDDWTTPDRCRTLRGEHPEIRYVEYPDAVHGFDAPATPVRVREGLGLVGKAKVGTNEPARAAAIAFVEKTLRDALK